MIQTSNNCFYEDCGKRLKITDLKCRCEYIYCSTHRLPETHACNYDYKTSGRDLLVKQNQPCIAKKILVL